MSGPQGPAAAGADATVPAPGTRRDAAVAVLRHALRGPVIDRAGVEYATARQVWNGAARQLPLAVACCADERDVANAVRIAREHGLPLSVRGGGHDWAGRALREDGLVLDMSALTAIDVDAGTAGGATARIGGGVRAGALAAAAHDAGYLPVTGTVNPVGVVGLTLAGGYGLLNGLHGLALDNLVEARVVLPDGTAVDASATEEPDLFWALRGGGGNFGVVTSARYRVHEAPPLLSGLLMYPFAEAGDVLRRYRDLIATVPGELTVMTGFFCGPDGVPMLFMLPLHVGADHDAAQAGLAGLGTPMAGGLTAMTYPEVIDISSASVVDGRHTAVDTRWLPDLSDAAIDAIVAAGAAVTSPYSAVFLHHFHGASTKVDPADTAFALRQEHLLVEIVATWLPTEAAPSVADGEQRAEDGARHRRWARDLSAALAGLALPGGYANLLGPDEQERVAAGYGDNADRLASLKRRFDPDGVLTAVPTFPARWREDPSA